MIVESNDAMVIVTLSNWLKNFAPVFQAVRGKIPPGARDFPRVLSKSQVIANASDCFIMLCAPAVIGRSYYFGIVFSTVI